MSKIKKANIICEKNFLIDLWEVCYIGHVYRRSYADYVFEVMMKNGEKITVQYDNYENTLKARNMLVGAWAPEGLVIINVNNNESKITS